MNTYVTFLKLLLMMRSVNICILLCYMCSPTVLQLITTKQSICVASGQSYMCCLTLTSCYYGKKSYEMIYEYPVPVVSLLRRAIASVFVHYVYFSACNHAAFLEQHCTQMLVFFLHQTGKIKLQHHSSNYYHIT